VNNKELIPAIRAAVPILESVQVYFGDFSEVFSGHVEKGIGCDVGPCWAAYRGEDLSQRS